MTNQTDNRHKIELLADDLTQRIRCGEAPSLSEYIDAHPDLADEIRHLFPTILAMEELKNRRLSSSARMFGLKAERLEQLGDYRIIREIGRGGMGIVYEAEQQSLGRHVAVKVFPQQVLRDSKHLKRFQREARTAACLHHTNIVQVFGVGEQDGLHYYVMQYISGFGLDRVIAQLRGFSVSDHACSTGRGEATIPVKANESLTRTTFTAVQGALAMLQGKLAPRIASGVPPDEFDRTDIDSDSDDLTPQGQRVTVVSSERLHTDGDHDGRKVVVTGHTASLQPTRNYWSSVAQIGEQVCDALHFAHAQGVLHRDIKPANLLLDAQGRVLITDFGLAKALSQDSVSQTDDVVGTVRYMAPEQFDGTSNARSDIYSLGLTLYELLTLQPAFHDTDRNRLMRRVTEGEPTRPSRLRSDVPRDLETIVLKAIARDPNHRYQTADEMAKDLRRFQQDLPILARRVGHVERLWRWSRRNPAVASLSAALLVVVAAAFVGISWKWREAEAETQRAQNENLRAENNLSLALDSMDQFLGRFASTWMAHPDAPEDEEEEDSVEFRMLVSDSTAAILQDALKFYDQFAQQNATNPRLRQDTATAHRRVGEIQARLGRYTEAEQAYRRTISILDEQAKEFPDDESLMMKTASVLNELSLVLYRVSRFEDARNQLDRAMLLLADVLERSPDSAQCRYELARTQSNLGSVLRWLRERDTGEVVQRKAIELLTQLVQEHPDKADYRLALARAYRNYYVTVAYGRDREERTDTQSIAVSILDQLVNDFPNVPDYQCELSETLSRISDSDKKLKDASEIQSELRRATDLARTLTTNFPTIPRYRRALARALREHAEFLQDSERSDEAEPLLSESVKHYQSLADQFGSVRAYKRDLARILHQHGDILRELERLPESRQALELAIAQQKSYVEARPDTRYGWSSLARQYESLSKTLNLLGEVNQADRAELEATEARKISDKRSRRRREG